VTSPERAPGKRGRLPNDPSKPRLLLARYLTGTDVPPAPPAVDYLSRVPSWPMYLNDTWGDCVPAAAGHLIQASSAYGQGATATVTDADILAAYSGATGFDPAAGPSGSNPTDQGTVIQDFLSYWRKTGVGGHKILAFFEVDVRDRAQVDAAMNLFGGLMVGVDLPASAEDQFGRGQTWSVVSPDGGILGGHCIVSGAYNTTARDASDVTWGSIQGSTDTWWDRYVSEAWGVVMPEWLDATGHSPTGLDLYALGEDLHALTGNPNPFPAPTPPPSPQPDPVDPSNTPQDYQLAKAAAKWLKHHHWHHVDQELAVDLTAWMRSRGYVE